MLSKRDLLILEIISKTSEPVGSWYIVNKLEENGINVSPATAGRSLHYLEKQGFLEKHGIKGRSITSAGWEKIQLIRKAQSLETHKKNLDNLINSKVLNQFLMVLEARKAIEKTSARLAAQHITRKELKKLENILKKQQTAYNDHKSAVQADIEFHKTIALASRNEAIYSLYMMLSMMGQQSKLFEELLKQLHVPYIGSHSSIFCALEKGSPEEAEKSMEAHLDRLKDDVNTYWHEFSENNSISIK